MNIRETYDLGCDYMSHSGEILCLGEYKKHIDSVGKPPKIGCLVKDPSGEVLGAIDNKEMADLLKIKFN